MPINSRGQRVNTHNQSKQKAQADELRKPQKSTGGPGVGTMGGAT